MLHIPTATLSFGKRAKNNLTKLIILFSSEVGLLQMNDSEWSQDAESRLDTDPDPTGGLCWPVLTCLRSGWDLDLSFCFSWLYLLSCSAVAEASSTHTWVFIQRYLCLSRLATDKQIFRSQKLELLGNKGVFLVFRPVHFVWHHLSWHHVCLYNFIFKSNRE